MKSILHGRVLAVLAVFAITFGSSASRANDLAPAIDQALAKVVLAANRECYKDPSERLFGFSQQTGDYRCTLRRLINDVQVTAYDGQCYGVFPNGPSVTIGGPFQVAVIQGTTSWTALRQQIAAGNQERMTLPISAIPNHLIKTNKYWVKRYAAVSPRVVAVARGRASPLIMTGHSMGGAIANLAAYDCREATGRPNVGYAGVRNVDSISFNSTRITYSRGIHDAIANGYAPANRVQQRLVERDRDLFQSIPPGYYKLDVPNGRRVSFSSDETWHAHQLNNYTFNEMAQFADSTHLNIWR